MKTKSKKQLSKEFNAIIGGSAALLRLKHGASEDWQKIYEQHSCVLEKLAVEWEKKLTQQ